MLDKTGPPMRWLIETGPWPNKQTAFGESIPVPISRGTSHQEANGTCISEGTTGVLHRLGPGFACTDFEFHAWLLTLPTFSDQPK